jgi:hypothetical protein
MVEDRLVHYTNALERAKQYLLQATGGKADARIVAVGMAMVSMTSDREMLGGIVAEMIAEEAREREQSRAGLGSSDGGTAKGKRGTVSRASEQRGGTDSGGDPGNGASPEHDSGRAG